MQCAVCSVQYAVCGVQCAVCSVQCAVCSVQCAVCSVQCAVCSVQCAVCSRQFARFTEPCEVLGEQYVSFNVDRVQCLVSSEVQCAVQSYLPEVFDLYHCH